MENIDTRVVGYGLLVTGLIIILLAGLNIFNILQGNSRAVSYFDFEPIEISLEALMGSEMSPQQRAAMIEQNGGEVPKIELVSKKMVDDTTNLLAHIFIVGLLISVGGRIATTGVYLLRPIKVNVAKENTKNA